MERCNILLRKCGFLCYKSSYKNHPVKELKPFDEALIKRQEETA